MKKTLFAFVCFSIFCMWACPANADILVTSIASPVPQIIRGGENIDILFFRNNFLKKVSASAEDEMVVEDPIGTPFMTMLFQWLCLTPDQRAGMYADEKFNYYPLPVYSEESVASEFDDVFVNATETSIQIARPILGNILLFDIDYIKFRNTGLIPVPYNK